MNAQLLELYAMKGELITQGEIIQAKLQEINQKISSILNLGAKPQIVQVPKEKEGDQK